MSAVADVRLRRNVVTLGADFGLFLIGLSFASQSTILPAFAAHLGAPNVVIGAIPAVMTSGWLLPSLLFAAHTESLPRRLPFVLRYTVWERAPFLVLALAAFALAGRAPRLTLAVLLGALLVVTATGGVLAPAWMDVVGRAIPTRLRGRFFAVVTSAASLGGLIGTFATTAILAAVPAPASYGYCFLIATAFLGASYVALALVEEPPVAVSAPPTPLTAYLRRVPGLLRRDRNFCWFLAARGASALGGMAGAFYAVHALRTRGAPDWWIGAFTAVLLAGQVAGTLAFGWLADRAGHRIVLLLGAAALVGGNVVALVAPTVAVFAAVFAFAGLYQAAASISNLNVLLEFAPTPDERPTYIGLGNTAVAPVAFGAPLAAGVIADGWGFERVFVLAGVCGAIAFSLYALCVHEPRARG